MLFCVECLSNGCVIYQEEIQEDEQRQSIINQVICFAIME